MPKGKKKRKQKPEAPPLSLPNKIIYWVLIIFAVVLLFAPFLLVAALQWDLGRANGAIAVSNDWSVLLLFIPSLPAAAVWLLFFGSHYQMRTPIIGRKKPRAKPHRRYSRKAKIIIALIISAWLLSFVPAIGAVYDRTEISETHIDEYAMFGRQTEHRSIEDATAVHVRIFKSTDRYRTRWQMSYTIYFADRKGFTFISSPAIMIEIDGLFEGLPKTADGTEYFEKIIDKYDLTPEEREKLQEVFLIEN